ncbi:MAG: lamin tail domain-containing protein, partial [Myxococcota bacterium]|nr:lamin tail domain-containing protein [Myxococcota bacterium]
EVNPLYVGTTFESITGFLHYSYGAWKLEPRDASDFAGHASPPCAGDACVPDLSAGDLIITEVMNDVPSGDAEDHCEWIEVYNNTTGSVDLQGLGVGDDDSSTGSVSTSVVVDAGSYTVLGKGSAAQWATDCPTLAAVITPSAHYGSGPNLSNGGDPVRIFQFDGTAIDETGTNITDASAADYSMVSLDADEGYSSELNAAPTSEEANDEAAEWCQASAEIGRSGVFGSPGAANACR